MPATSIAMAENAVRSRVTGHMNAISRWLRFWLEKTAAKIDAMTSATIVDIPKKSATSTPAEALSNAIVPGWSLGVTNTA